MRCNTLKIILVLFALCMPSTNLAAEELPLNTLAQDTLPHAVQANKDDAEPIVVCIPIGNPPFAFLNADGELDGFHPDLLKHVEINRPMHIDTTDMSTAIARLQDGTCHMLLSNITITKERARLLLFSKPYMHSSIHALVFKESPIGTKDDLLYSIIGVRKGGVAEEYAFEHLTGSTLYALRETDTLINMLLDGSIEAIIDSYSFLQTIASKHDQLQILEPPVLMEEYAYAFSPGQSELRDIVNNAISLMQDSGLLKKMYEKWFQAPQSPTH